MGYANKKTKRRRHDHFYKLGQKLVLLQCQGSHRVYKVGSVRLSDGTDDTQPGEVKHYWIRTPDGAQFSSWSQQTLLTKAADYLGVENVRKR